MALPINQKKTINVGLPNESVGSDSLYTAFNKINDNFTNIWNNASPYNTFNANGSGIGITSYPANGVILLQNTGVTSLVAGDDSITLSASNGNVTITASAGGNGGGVSNVNVVGASNTRITSTGGPILSNGTITLDLAKTGVALSNTTYTNPTITVDPYGRILSASNNSITGSVTSVGLTPGAGIAITGGPITSAGTMTVTNTGVVQINPGAGIGVSSTSGVVTIFSLATGTVTSVSLSSSSLNVIGSPITTAGSYSIELPGNLRLQGSEDLANGAAVSLSVTSTYFSTGATGETATLAAGSAGQLKTFMMVADGGGDMVITVTNAGWKSSGTGTMTFGDIGDGCTLQYINSKWFCVGNNGVVFA